MNPVAKCSFTGVVLLVLFWAFPLFSSTVNLPFSASSHQMNSGGPVITVSKNAVLYNGTYLGSTTIITQIPEKEKDPIVKVLVPVLQTLKEKKSYDSVFIQIDKTHSFRVLFTLLNTCSSQKIRDIHLMARGDGGKNVFLPLKNPFDEKDKDNGWGSISKKVVIAVSDTAIGVGYRNNFPASFIGINLTYAQIKDTLTVILDDLKKQDETFFNTESVILAIEKNIPYSRVIRSIDFAYAYGYSHVQITSLRYEKRIDSVGNKKTRGPSGTVLRGRSKKSIMTVVASNLQDLTDLYNENRKSHSQDTGRIIVKFTINQYGMVIAARIQESNFGDYSFEKKVLLKIRQWEFGKIDKPNDETEVIYPFVFKK